MRRGYIHGGDSHTEGTNRWRGHHEKDIYIKERYIWRRLTNGGDINMEKAYKCIEETYTKRGIYTEGHTHGADILYHSPSAGT